MTEPAHGNAPASGWIVRWSHLVPAGGTILDLACGRGRHARWFAGRGHPVVALDRSPQALAALADLACGIDAPQIQTVLADVENDAWPLNVNDAPRSFDGVVVTNYLWRALLPTIVRSVAPGGVLLYETFTDGNASVGKPSRPDFLLQTGELLAACQGLRVVAFEDGFCTDPQRFVQRIAAVRSLRLEPPQRGETSVPRRYPL